MVGAQAMGYAISAVFVMGILMPGVDNYAHAGGFAGGYLAGMWLDPLKPERMDHIDRGRLPAALPRHRGVAVIARWRHW